MPTLEELNERAQKIAEAARRPRRDISMVIMLTFIAAAMMDDAKRRRR